MKNTHFDSENRQSKLFNRFKQPAASMNSILNLFVGLGKLLLPPQPTRPGLIAIRTLTFKGACHA